MIFKTLFKAAAAALLCCFTAGCAAEPQQPNYNNYSSYNYPQPESSFVYSEQSGTPSDAAEYSSVPLFTDMVPGRPKDNNTKKDSGIIMGEWGFDGKGFLKITSVDPKSGSQSNISTFYFYEYDPQGAFPRLFVSTSAPLRRIFSSDYKYLAFSKSNYETGEVRAGFYGEDGEYWDVSKATDSVRSEFEEPIRQYAIGFTDDDYLIFAEGPAFTLGNFKDYSPYTIYKFKVEISSAGMKKNPKELFDGDLNEYLGIHQDWLGEYNGVTDKIDDNLFIIEHGADPNASRLRNMMSKWEIHTFNKATKEDVCLVSGDVRTNWSGVVSPDGEKVAFLSAPQKGGAAAIYYVPINGGTPVKVCENISAFRSIHGAICVRPSDIGIWTSHKSLGYYFLLEWK